MRLDDCLVPHFGVVQVQSFMSKLFYGRKILLYSQDESQIIAENLSWAEIHDTSTLHYILHNFKDK